MEVFACTSAFSLRPNNQIQCPSGVLVISTDQLPAGINLVGCQTIKKVGNRLACFSGFQNQTLLETNGINYNMIGSSAIQGLDTRIQVTNFYTTSIKKENMTTLNQLGIAEISLITASTLAILLTAYVFRAVRRQFGW